jgi:hypothetical protein
MPEHPDVIALGFVDEQTKWDALAACDFLIMPSLYESLSMVLLEAWSVGKPVLVNGACEVLVGQCRRAQGGLWYNNFEEFSLIIEQIDRSVQDQLGRQGKNFVQNTYSWSAIEDSYLRVVEGMRSGLVPSWLTREHIVWAYRLFLDREPEHESAVLEKLNAWTTTKELRTDFMASSEFHLKNLDLKKKELELLPIIGQRPSSYHLVDEITGDHKILTFFATQTTDFDWLESMILANGYYEKEGIWGFEIDIDKRVMAEMICAFMPYHALEIGCANGPVLQVLHENNIRCEGVEISQFAIQRAFPDIKNQIHHGDLLSIALLPQYDFVFGFDVFEHLNPNKLDKYLAKISSVMVDGGYLFCNIPAFGEDPIFGLVFPLYIAEWQQDILHRKNFSAIHVDQAGYPVNGHLIWADSSWWVAQFAKHGFLREKAIEKAFHEKYDNYMQKASIARKSYYVFSKKAKEQNSAAILSHIRSTPSHALKSFDPYCS